MRIEDPRLKQLSRVSPSRYTAVQACLLREVWNASGNEPLLPISPAAELGRVIHQLLEAAGRGKLGDGEQDQIEVAWKGFITEAEEKMSLSWLRRPQVPLSKSIPDFEVRRLRACRMAMEVAKKATSTREVQDIRSRGHPEFEIWVETEDGAVGGCIDRAKKTKEGIVISDYKSGSLLEGSRSNGLLRVNEAYRAQMELYAALYRCRFGEWPVGLEILPLQGAKVKLSYTPESAEHLLEQARFLLHDANRRISDVQSGRNEEVSLASPRAENCRVCLFRPACHAYWIVRERETAQKWPYDLRGVLTGKTTLHNGKLCMQISAKFISDRADSIRNISNSLKRHPALQFARIGSQLEVYGLRYLFRSGDFSETQSTVIYQRD